MGKNQRKVAEGLRKVITGLLEEAAEMVERDDIVQRARANIVNKAGDLLDYVITNKRYGKYFKEEELHNLQLEYKNMKDPII